MRSVSAVSSLDDYQWLVSDEGADWLRRAAAVHADALTLGKQLRRSLPPQRAALISETLELRGWALAKFPRAAQMFFTRRALEQATDAALARYKASRFSPDAPVWDLCCGIGGDALGLAGRVSSVYAVDRDPIMTLLTAANARALESACVETITSDAERVDIPASACLHADPDRRATGRRVARQVDDYAPSWESLQTKIRQAAGAAIKLAPAAWLPDEPAGTEREWISRRGECRQQVAWIGSLARWPDRRVATQVDDNGQITGQFSGVAGGPPAPLSDAKAYVYEPDAALLAAELTDAFAHEYQLARLFARVAYLTSDERLVHPLLAAFRVDEVLPLDVRRLRAVLRQRGIGALEVKKRAVDIDPSRLVKQLDLCGTQHATLLLSPTQKGTRAILAKRLTCASVD